MIDYIRQAPAQTQSPEWPWRVNTVNLVLKAAIAVGENPKRLTGRSIEPHLAQARFAVMLHLHERGWNASRIGRALKRDHSTVLHGLKRAKAMRQTSVQFAALCEAIV